MRWIVLLLFVTAGCSTPSTGDTHRQQCIVVNGVYKVHLDGC